MASVDGRCPATGSSRRSITAREKRGRDCHTAARNDLRAGECLHDARATRAAGPPTGAGARQDPAGTGEAGGLQVPPGRSHDADIHGARGVGTDRTDLFPAAVAAVRPATPEAHRRSRREEVPPSAAPTSPPRVPAAPVKAPLRAERSSSWRTAGEIAPQLTGTNAPVRPLRACSSRAASSFGAGLAHDQDGRVPRCHGVEFAHRVPKGGRVPNQNSPWTGSSSAGRSRAATGFHQCRERPPDPGLPAPRARHSARRHSGCPGPAPPLPTRARRSWRASATGAGRPAPAPPGRSDCARGLS